MKKLFFASAVMLGALCSCSNDEVAAPSADNGAGEETGLVPVQLTLNRPSVLASVRGLGTVGGVDEATNKWNGEDLYVFMMRRSDDAGNADFSKSEWTFVDATGTPVPQTNFYNEKLTAPVEAVSGDLYSTTVEAYDPSKPKFYPMDRSLHDFFAYHIDDAFVDANSDNVPDYDDTTEPTKITVPFVIDGSQDLMAGKAIPGTDAVADPSKAYSAQSARANVIPNIQMKHLLSRLTFEVKGGDSNANGLIVNKIAVKSKKTGHIVAAYSSANLTEGAEVLAPEDLIYFDDFADETDNEDVNKVYLKQKDASGTGLVELVPMALTAPAEDFTPIGEALMVSPGLEEYELFVTTTQTMGDLQNVFVHSAPITIVGGAVAGTSYKVQITLFGASEIKVQTTLSAWTESGEVIPVTPSEF